MKILIIQLARLGDVYMSWPATRALRRKYPEAEIHFLVRPRFKGATDGLEAINRVVELPTAEVIEPFFQMEENEALSEALARTDRVLDSLRAEKYDLILNWSFSPLSSWVTKSITHEHTRVLGYTRFIDGTLNLNDDLSAYFYAQVGTERANRVHLSDLFAVMLEEDLQPQDWVAPITPEAPLDLPEKYWVLHVGASEGHKRIEPWQWARLVQEYAGFHGENALPVVLIGSAEEWTSGDAVEKNVNRVPVINLCGKTNLLECFAILKKAQLLVGADSAPLHMASLTQTPTLNLSAGRVNFWETGPRSPKSWVYRLDGSRPLPSALLGSRVCRLLEGDSPEDLLTGVPGIPSFAGLFPMEDEFTWGLLQAVYFGGGFPLAEELQFIQVIDKLYEMNQVVSEQLTNPRLTHGTLGQLVERADEVFEVLGKMDANVAVLIRWLQAERSRIAPGTVDEVRQKMADCHRRFHYLLRPYCLEDVGKDKERGKV